MKKRVALCVNGWNGENLDKFIRGFLSYFNEDEIDLFIFTSHVLIAQSLFMRNAENSIYTMADYSFFDAVVVFGSGLNIDGALDEILKKCKEANVPIILQGEDVEGIHSVTVDNYAGMRSLCEHLIETHNVKEVVFLAGTRENEDSNLRLRAVRDTLEAYGYTLDDDHIVYANWDGWQVHSFITGTYKDKKKLPDAIVCANDVTAMFALTSLELVDVKVPEDVLVTGFDNMSEGNVFCPSLSSVEQCYFEQGNECAKIFSEIIHNKGTIKKRIIPCAASPGESCGCMDCKNETELRKMLGHDTWHQKFIYANLHRREKELETCILSKEEYESIPEGMNTYLESMSGEEDQDFHIYINPQFKNLEYMNRPEEEFSGDYYGPVLDVWGARSNGKVKYEKTMHVKELLLGYKAEGKGKKYVFIPLRIESFAVGYMVIGYSDSAFSDQRYAEFSGSMNSILAKFQNKMYLSKMHKKEIDALKEINGLAKKQFMQTVLALATAVDAKDKYTHGHSRRVAEYSRRIAEATGKSEERCEQVYFAALLHDIGKIGILDSILTKEGKLTEEEFAIIKQHPDIGNSILGEVSETPYLALGAHYHHERYDGTGYPSGLKGEDIPEIARIIAVADSYDAMTSNRSYRTPLAQQKVREELVRGLGRQFDPEFATVMIHILDKDVEYQLRDDFLRFGKLKSEYIFDEYKQHCTSGIAVSDHITRISFVYEQNVAEDDCVPTIVIFDSLDEQVYTDEKNQNKMDFTGFCDISLHGDVLPGEIRNYQIMEFPNNTKIKSGQNEVLIETVKQRDHVLLRILISGIIQEYTIVLRDRSQWVFTAITGKKCRIHDLKIEIHENAVKDGYIKRIAEEISYIRGKEEGNLKNLEIAGWREIHSPGVLLEKNLDISFHSMSLPASRRLWHCPIVVIFTSENGMVNGPGYREIVQVRLDGESWSEDPTCENTMKVTYDEYFVNWENWKRVNREGLNCKIHIERDHNKVLLTAEDGGIHIRNITTISEQQIPQLYCALTGDQVAITEIYLEK